MKLFKAATAYRLTGPPLDLSGLKNNPVKDLAPGQISSVGWENPCQYQEMELPFYNFGTVADQTHFTILQMVTTEKKVPMPAVKLELEKRVDLIYNDEGRRVSRKERQTIKEEIIFDVVKTLLPVQSVTMIYIDWRHSLVVVGEAKVTKAEKALSELRVSIGSLPVEIITTAARPEDVLTRWSTNNDEPPHIELLGDAVFKNPTELSQTARVKHLDADGDGIAGILKEGLVAQELALKWNVTDSNSISMVMTDRMTMKQIVFSDEMIFTDDNYEDSELAFRAAAIINCDSISQILLEAHQLFGGYIEA